MISCILLEIYLLYLTLIYLLKEQVIRNINYELFLLRIFYIIFSIELNFSKTLPILVVLVIKYVEQRNKIETYNIDEEKILYLLNQDFNKHNYSIMKKDSNNYSIKIKYSSERKKFINLAKTHINNRKLNKRTIHLNKNSVCYLVASIVFLFIIFHFFKIKKYERF